MEKNIIEIGTIYKLNDKYSSNYKLAIMTYDLETRKTIVWLKSNWNSVYNKTIRFKHGVPLDIAKEFGVTK